MFFNKFSILILLAIAVKCMKCYPYVFTCPAQHSCGNSSDTRKPIYLLILVPFSDERLQAGWDYGIQMLPGARIARDYINCNRDDLLEGHRIELIESSHEACGYSQNTEEAYLNLVRFGFHEECGTVAAVVGLACSPSTAAVSRLVGNRPTRQLLQLSASGSPIFDWDTNFTTYHRLWRYVSSASVYVDTMIALMEQFNWDTDSVGLVQDLDSLYYINIAKFFKMKIKRFCSVGIEKTSNYSLDKAILSIKSSGAKIIFVSATFIQAALLICRAEREGLLHPYYHWVFIDMYVDDFKVQNVCEISLNKTINGSLLFRYSLPTLDSEDISGGLKINNYSDMYHQYLSEVEKKFEIPHQNETIRTGSIYGNILFDQVWSFANALNNSLPRLVKENLSLDNIDKNVYITDILEEELSKLNIPGVSANIAFTDGRVVPSTIEIAYFNGLTEERIGYFQNTSLVYFKQNFSLHLIERKQVYLTVDTSVMAILCLAVLITFIFVTIVLVLFLCYKSHPEVKASSPYLRLFVHVGCYLLCLAASIQLIMSAFGGCFITDSRYEVMCGMEVMSESIGYTLILATLFVIQLRVKRIFSNNHLIYLSDMWNNSTLAIIIIILCVAQGLFTIANLTIYRPDFNESRRLHESSREEHFIIFCNVHTLTYGIIILPPLIFYVIPITFIAIASRRVRYSQFRDTKKINFFVSVLIVLMTFIIATWFILYFKNLFQYLAVLQAVIPLAFAFTCQTILFVPKIIPICYNRSKNR